MKEEDTNKLNITERRAAIVDAINTSVNIFTSHLEKEFNDVISRGLKSIVEAVGLDRVAIYRRMNIEGEARFGQLYRWDKINKGLVSLDEDLTILPKIPIIEKWLKTLMKDECIRVRKTDMTKEEAVFLNEFGVKSILIVPIFSHGEFWGAVALQDHTNDVYFDEGCSDLIFSAARLCANAIIRAEMSDNANKAVEALKRREKMANMLNKMAVTFLSESQESFEAMMTEGVRLIADMISLDRLSVWRNFLKSDGLHTSQIYRWDRESGGTTVPTAVLKDVTYSQLAPSWEFILKSGESINSPARLLPKHEAAILKTFGVVSVFVSPVFLNNEFWGFVLFEDREKELFFEDDATEIMRSAAFLCANTVMRTDMERKIANVNEFNRATLNGSPIGFTVFDDNVNIIECNDAIVHQLKTTKEYYCEHFDEFSPEYQADGSKSSEKTIEIVKKALNGEKQVREWQHQTSDGEIIPFEITLTRTMYNGKYIVLGYQYDLLNIKKMENIIAEENELNRSIINASRIGFILFDENLRVMNVNNANLELFGCDKQYFIEHFYEFSPEYQPNGDNSYESMKESNKRVLNGEKMTMEWMHRSCRGELIPFEITLTRTKYKGKYLLLSYQYDLRNIKKMTEEFKIQSKQLKDRLDQQELLSDISRSFVTSGDTHTLVNEAITKLGNYYKVSRVVIFKQDFQSDDASVSYIWTSDYNLPRRENFNPGKIVKASFPERLYNSATVPILSCPDTTTSKIDDFRELLHDSVNAFICAPLYVEGLLWGLLAVEQCKIPRYWTDVEKSFIAMTASTIAGAIMLDIYNTKLKDAVTKVTAASKAKSEFLSNMSHEMRTPMNAIINMTLIAKNAENLERKNYALDKIADASTHLLGVINDILDMSKIEANKFELYPVKCSFEKILQRVINVITFRVEEKHQSLTVHIENNIPKFIICDDQRLSQIITNLLSNAVKFTPEYGLINLDAKLIKEKKSVCTLQISVSDTGIGISKDHQAYLFQAFQQAETSTARTYGGTGLGLSISKKFVEMMGGMIWVESEIGKGSTFTFTVKVEHCEEEKEQELLKDIVKEKDFSGHRVLLVEDMEINREIVLMLLEETNLEIDCAADGLQAVEMFIEEPERYEMILMDVHMPGMDGYEATKEIRSIEEKLKTRSKYKKRIPIIAMTANVFKEDINHCIKAGMDDHIGKPLDYEILLDKLRYYIFKKSIN